MSAFLVLGELAYKLKVTGITEVSKSLGELDKKFDDMEEKQTSGLGKLNTAWLALGAASGMVFAKMIGASPRLRAQMQLINFQANRMFRAFGDELAPVFKIVAGALKGVIDWFKGLPEPLQKAITVGVATAVMVGLLAGAFALLSLAASPITAIILGIAIAAALLYLAWETNFGGIREVVESIVEKIKPLLEGIMNLLGLLTGQAGATGGGFQDAFAVIEAVASSVFGSIGSWIEHLIGQFQAIVDFLTAVFKGDTEGALKAIQDLFANMFGGIVDIVLWPIKAFDELLKALTGAGLEETLTGIITQFQTFFSDIVTGAITAGQDLITGFIKGIQDAMAAAVKAVDEILDWVAGFFGGSLPERGPLMNIEKFGEEIGTIYTMGIAKGLQRPNISHQVERNIQIGQVTMRADKRDFGSKLSFGRKLETEAVRRVTAW